MRTNVTSHAFLPTFGAKPIAIIKYMGNNDVVLYRLSGKIDRKYLQTLKIKSLTNHDMFENEIQKMIISKAADDIYSPQASWILAVQDKKAFGLMKIEKKNLLKTGYLKFMTTWPLKGENKVLHSGRMLMMGFFDQTKSLETVIVDQPVLGVS